MQFIKREDNTVIWKTLNELTDKVTLHQAILDIFLYIATVHTSPMTLVYNGVSLIADLYIPSN